MTCSFRVLKEMKHSDVRVNWIPYVLIGLVAGRAKENLSGGSLESKYQIFCFKICLLKCSYPMVLYDRIIYICIIINTIFFVLYSYSPIIHVK